ncbi:Cyclin-dependent kinase 10 [Rhizophlyctis rosea]|uniref:Cyclin-dependent kinase 10 n=1 Tax=Rhizophlyctis rosea TaxID=64517 RepID=A0AAD5SHD6_9FUNG|nr:Cyclin-dependent kinase 10 [Rhizophlyctis rosea]
MSNLLLTSKGILKIADFGLARKFGTPSKPMTPKVVTLWYRAPEVLFGEKVYTTAIDMWSVGCIFGELLLTQPLLPGKIEQHQIELICKLLGTPNDRIWSGLSSLPLFKAITLPAVPYEDFHKRFERCKLTENAMALLKGLLTYGPRARLDVKSALDSQWFWDRPPASAPILLPTFPEGRNEGAYDSNVKAYQRRKEERQQEFGGIRGLRNNFAEGKGMVVERRIGSKRFRDDESDLNLELGEPPVQHFRLS